MELPVNKELYNDYLWYWNNTFSLKKEYGDNKCFAVLDEKVIAVADTLSDLEKDIQKIKPYREALKVLPPSPTIYERAEKEEKISHLLYVLDLICRRRRIT